MQEGDIAMICKLDIEEALPIRTCDNCDHYELIVFIVIDNNDIHYFACSEKCAETMEEWDE